MTTDSSAATKKESDVASEWEAVIGLEIHSELNTKSKLFSSAPNRFGDEPNTNITDVCTGMPGTLPVLNKEVVRKAVMFGLAIGGDVRLFSKFDRKSYFYPDSPRNFQITQLEEPIVLGGRVVAEVNGHEKAFDVDRVHIEDDAGMLKHFSKFAGVDYNRAGVPLIEIVSKPCLHTPQEASAYAMGVKAILEYLNVSDCNMEQGHLRFDANISVRKRGETALRRKTEIKNMNSFSNMEAAVAAEIQHQIRQYTLDPAHQVPQATYRWDTDTRKLIMMRKKESADDYRYFPEPDLPPIVLNKEYIDDIRQHLPELPLERKRRYTRDLKLPEDLAYLLASEKQLADFYEKGLEECDHPRQLANWMVVEFAGRIKEEGTPLWSCGIPPAHIAELVTLIDAGTITGKIAKKVANEMVAHRGKSAKQIVAENPDYQPISDTGEIEALVDQVLSDNPQSINDFKAGKDRAFGFLVGQVMKATRGKAPPQLVNELLKKKLS